MSEPVSDLSQFRTAFLYQLRSYLRTWRFVGLLIFVALVATAILAVQLHRGIDAVTGNNPSATDYLTGYLSTMVDAIVITAAFLGGDALAVDLGGGPGYLMLAQPVRRRTLLAGRFLAASVTGLAIGLVYYAYAVVAVVYFYGNVPGALGLSIGIAFLFLLASLAIAFFFSSFFRNPTVSIVASLLILIIGFPLLTSIGDLSGVEPWFSLDYGGGAITSVLSTNFVHETTMHLGGAGARGTSITLYSFSPYPWEGAVILTVYILVFLTLTFLVYRYREVKG
ncbi:MAG TPA: ABC transporter permease [Thermoplasmata archaeon]|nr:ABC transporter permease [Thermoplasmata archaeon]